MKRTDDAKALALIAVLVAIIFATNDVDVRGDAMSAAAAGTPQSTLTQCSVASIDQEIIKQQPYLLKQAAVYVGTTKKELPCTVLSGSKVNIQSYATCRPYPGPSGNGATLECPTFVLYTDSASGEVKGTCWDQQDNPSCKSDEEKAGAGNQTADTSTADQSRENLKELLGEDKVKELEEHVYDLDKGFAFNTTDGAIADTPTLESMTMDSSLATNGASSPFTTTANSGGLPASVGGTNPVSAGSYNPSSGVGTSNYFDTSSGQSAYGDFDAGTSAVSQTAPQRLVYGYNNGNAFSQFAEAMNERLANNNAYVATQNGQYVGNVQQIPYAISYTSPAGMQSSGQEVYQMTVDDIKGTFIDNSYSTTRALAQNVAYNNATTTTTADSFSEVLKIVGGPNAYANAGTKNEAYGKIQDLIIEKDAMDAMEAAEAAGETVKNQVFCEANETSADCMARRETYAAQVERATFIDEMIARNLSDSAVAHFLAVYDGVIDPSPAPASMATSTLKAMYAQQNASTSPYTTYTSATDFVLWLAESVADVAKNAAEKVVDTVTEWFGGIGDSATTDAQ